jgi:hypothetical protein
MAPSGQMHAVAAAVVAGLVPGLLAGAAIAGDVDDALEPALWVGGMGLMVAALCLRGVRMGVPWPGLMLASTVAAGAAAALLAVAVIARDGEKVSSLTSSTGLGALFGAGCAALVRVIVTDPAD